MTTAPATPPETNSYFTLYLSPYGNDSYDGKTSGSAVLTLSRIQSILKSVDPSSSVQVIIAPGTYYNQRTSWNYTHSQYSIEFMTTSGNEGLAIFDGCPGPNISLPSSQCTGGTFFNLSSSTGESTNLIFHGLKIQNYWAGITFVGNSSSPSLSNWNNRIENCEFNNIGNVFNPNLSYGMYAVELWNSHSNIIQNNKFNNIINVNNEGWLHGVYASIYANDNQILGNTFNKVTGDPIRIRNRSNNNIVQGNVFIQSRIYGSYSDWYCRPDEGYNCDMLECPSWNNQFSSNTYGYNYVGDNIQPTAVFQSNNEWMSYSINKFSPCFSQ